ncbi:MAG TPA: SPFH domain-containing protein [Thermoanaerobaculia bacterium]|jgi:regulator of protease activity HflC (stomatin/prohibitin superfamily)
MNPERSVKGLSGYGMLFFGFVLLAASVWSFLGLGRRPPMPTLLTALGLFIVSSLVLAGLFIVNPNEAKVLVLFGKYAGTVRENGFRWANPFYLKKRISLRARNLNGEKLKVNDRAGNPIQIAAVVVWQVQDTFRALFDVEHYESYVVIQSEAAVRHLAGRYPYDNLEDDHDEGMTLRGGMDQVSKELERELQERFQRAGIRVLEARISHLAYAPEIAEAMLRRQQAAAVVAARFQIVNGAVSMVELALEKLSERKVVSLDEERKAAMVSNLLVVLCSESAASPVINAGTLYQ